VQATAQSVCRAIASPISLMKCAFSSPYKCEFASARQGARGVVATSGDGTPRDSSSASQSRERGLLPQRVEAVLAAVDAAAIPWAVAVVNAATADRATPQAALPAAIPGAQPAQPASQPAQPAS
jgi:hypothetical protein